MKPEKIYLGDGAYAEWTGSELILTAEDGINVTDIIVLEPIHLELLSAFFTRMTAAYKKTGAIPMTTNTKTLMFE